MTTQENLAIFISKIKQANNEKEVEDIMWDAFENYGREFAETLSTILEDN